MQLVFLDIDPETGRAVPVSVEVMLEETENWTLPMPGLNVHQRQKWRERRKRALAKGMNAEEAWYWASSIFAAG